MKFEASDRAKLLKIGVLSLLDLALVLPKGFEDTTIAKSPREGQICIKVNHFASLAPWNANGACLLRAVAK